MNPFNIMVVDDHPPNLKLLQDMLSREGYRVRCFPRGRLALSAAGQHPPDLILLDITMPEMDGYEVCRRLKADPKSAGIPIIFLSALGEAGDKILAFQAGGVDYVTKPFQIEEVRARVETHLELHRLQRALQTDKEHLEETVRARSRDLAEAHARLKLLDRAKSEFLNLISHELRTPLNGILGIGEVIFSELSALTECSELREMFERSGKRIVSIVDYALLITQIGVQADSFAPASLPLSRVVGRALDEAADLASSRGVKLAPSPANLGEVVGHEDLLVKALQALLETAATFSKPGETVGLAHYGNARHAGLVIETESGTIPAQVLPRFFDLLSVTEADTSAGDLGLRPPVASSILSLFGGSVSVENQNPAGIRLTIALQLPLEVLLPLPADIQGMRSVQAL
jgi:two-component system sensor histidine kinase/response regulator